MKQGFLLKKPDAKRRTFQILPYSRIDGRKVYEKPLKSPELDALNQSLLAGTLTVGDVLLEIKTKLLPELKRRAGILSRALVDARVNEHNDRVFKEFWNKEYRRAKLERPSTARDEFKRALLILEPLSLHTSTVDEIQDHWDKREKGTRHKRYGNRINQLLKFLGRGFEIVTDRAVVPPLKWVSWEELEEINEYVSNDALKDLYRSLYGTGARLGELFLLEPGDVRENETVYIHRQMTPKGEVKEYTKNKKSHDTIVLEEALPALRRWAAVKDKASYRKRCQHPLIDAAEKAFPNDPIKQISPHKLRHSYVKKMTQLGVPLERIAQFLGDRVSTIEQTYRQWTVTDPEIDHIKAMMREGYKRLKKKA